MNMTSTKVSSLITMTSVLLLLLLLPLCTDSVSLRHQQHRRQIEEDVIVDTPSPPPPAAMALRPRRISSVDRPDMVTMIPQQSCYYQAWNKRLTCNCNSTDTAAFLHLKMKYYVTGRDSADISAVYLQACKELVVILDLNKVDASLFPIHFRQIMKVKIEKIQYEPKFMDRQELKLVFDNVEQLMFKKVFVEDTLLLRASNVKDLHFIESNFAHIPPRGFEISRARMLDIRDSTFWRVSARSIVVEKTKEVNVLKNEMTINALKVVYAKDGSHLMISCNRLLGQPISPECSRTTTTTTTTTTTRRPYIYSQDTLKEQERAREGEEDEGILAYLPELIGGVVVGILLITVVCFLFVCLLRRKKREDEKPETAETAIATQATEMETQTEGAGGEGDQDKPKKRQAPLPPPSEEQELLGKHPDSDGEEEEETSESGPRIAPPVWLEEIQRNKIFNRQKSLLSQEGLKDLADSGKVREEPIQENGGSEVAQNGLHGGEEELPPPPAAYSSPSPQPPSTAEEVKESSRTESDEDIDRQQLLLMQQQLQQASPVNNQKSKAYAVSPDEGMHEESAL